MWKPRVLQEQEDWLDQADQARAWAEQLTSSEARQQMIEVAQFCDKLALWSEEGLRRAGLALQLSRP